MVNFGVVIPLLLQKYRTSSMKPHNFNQGEECQAEELHMIGTSANPFTHEKYVILRWSGWSFSAHFETGRNVAADANYVASVVEDCPPEVKDCTDRIRFALYSRLMRDEISRINSFGR